jgi:hypothetical protein
MSFKKIIRSSWHRLPENAIPLLFLCCKHDRYSDCHTPAVVHRAPFKQWLVIYKVVSESFQTVTAVTVSVKEDEKGCQVIWLFLQLHVLFCLWWMASTVKTRNVEKIQELIHKDCCRTIQKITGTPGICYGVSYEILTENLTYAALLHSFFPKSWQRVKSSAA